MKLKKLLAELNIPIKVGDTILVGKWRNKPVKVEKIGKDEYGLPTVNGRPIMKIRLQKKGTKKEGKLTEMPHGKSDRGSFDLQIEKYSVPEQEKKALMRAYNSDAGVWGYSDKYDAVVIFKRTGVIVQPNGPAQSFVEPKVSGKPRSVAPENPGGRKLPPNWEKFVVGRY